MSRYSLSDARGHTQPGLIERLHGAAVLPPVDGNSVAGAGGGASSGSGALARALDRWRRVVRPDGPPVVAAPTVTPAADLESVATLARRLDDSGCSYGRVSAAKLEQVIRAYDRLETKLNAVLMAVTGTFLSTLAGLLLYYVRGGGQ